MFHILEAWGKIARSECLNLGSGDRERSSLRGGNLNLDSGDYSLFTGLLRKMSGLTLVSASHHRGDSQRV